MHVDLDPDVAVLLGDTAADVVRRAIAPVAAAAGGHRDGGPVAFIDDAVSAERQGEGDLWRLTGSTSGEWVTGSGPAQTFVVLATDATGAQGAFAVNRSGAGVTFGPPARTTGLRAAGRAPLSLTATPATLIGDGAAAAAARRMWLLGLAATAVGVARSGLDLAATHLRNRVQFRTTLSRFPALRALVSALDDDLIAAFAAVTAACREPARIPGAARTAAATAVRVTGEAIQLHGGYGYIVDTGVERLFRDTISIRARVLGAIGRAGDEAVETLLGPA